MNNTNEPAAAEQPAVRVGIIERLKAATEPETIIELTEEVRTYAQASAKTIRRFEKILRRKAIDFSDEQREQAIGLLRVKGLA